MKLTHPNIHIQLLSRSFAHDIRSTSDPQVLVNLETENTVTVPYGFELKEPNRHRHLFQKFELTRDGLLSGVISEDVTERTLDIEVLASSIRTSHPPVGFIVYLKTPAAQRREACSEDAPQRREACSEYEVGLPKTPAIGPPGEYSRINSNLLPVQTPQKEDS